MKVLKCTSSNTFSITIGKTYICFDRSHLYEDTYFFVNDSGHMTTWGKNEKRQFTMIDVTEDRDNKLNELLK